MNLCQKCVIFCCRISKYKQRNEKHDKIMLCGFDSTTLWIALISIENDEFSFLFIIKELQTCNNNRIWLHLCNISRWIERCKLSDLLWIEFVILFDFWSVHYALCARFSLSFYFLLNGMSGSWRIFLCCCSYCYFFPRIHISNIHHLSRMYFFPLFKHTTFVRVYF